MNHCDKVNTSTKNTNNRAPKNENYFAYVSVLEFYLLKGKNRFAKFTVKTIVLNLLFLALTAFRKERTSGYLRNTICSHFL